MNFIDLKSQYQRLKADIDAGIQRVLDHGQFILGPEVTELEEKLAAYTGARHCITVANGTDALQIAQMALGIGPGDEVITPGFNYIAAAETTALLGARPVYVDIDPRTYNLDPELLEAAITPATRAIIPVSLYGQCADFDAINVIAARHGIPVIEDAAQSFGAIYKERKSCNLTRVACTSFFPEKAAGLLWRWRRPLYQRRRTSQSDAPDRPPWPRPPLPPYLCGCEQPPGHVASRYLAGQARDI